MDDFESAIILGITGLALFTVLMHIVILGPEAEANIECQSRGYVEAVSYPMPLAPDMPLICTGTAVVIREEVQG